MSARRESWRETHHAISGEAAGRGRRGQAERSDATRAALLDAARELFAEHGFAAVGTEAIVSAAGVTRGALYHQFADKRALFTAVVERIEEEMVEQIGVLLADVADPAQVLELGVEAWLAVAVEPAVSRIVLIDAPAVLDWERWRAAGVRNGLGIVEAALAAAVEHRVLPRQPVRPLAHVLIGALEEAARYVARADDPANARAEVRAVFRDLVAGLERRGAVADRL